MTNHSIWLETYDYENHPSLTQDIAVDIAIIGGGITGITTALELLPSGKEIAIFEAEKIASGTTSYSTANLYAPVMQSHHTITSKFNQQAVNTIIQSRSHAIDYIESTIRKLNIDCHFYRRPLYLFTHDNKKIKWLEKEMTILQMAKISIKEISSFPLDINALKIIKLEDQARFNPYIYVNEIATYLASKGCKIFENTSITKIEENKNQCILYANGKKIVARKVVMATHIPKGINLKQMLTFPYRSYVVGIKHNNQYQPGHFWDLDSMNSISVHNVFSNENDILLIAGSNHKVGQPRLSSYNQHYEELEKYAKQHFKTENIHYRWSAQHYQSADLVPFVGLAHRFSKHLYMATGFATDGLTYGTVAGILLSDLLQDKPNSWHDLYDTKRFKPIAIAQKMIKENVNVTCRYIKDNLCPASRKPGSELKPDEASIIKIDGKKCAAYRDNENNLHVVSAICPHMQCVVNWNEAEKTWDCPCHGSRFSVDGKVIEGPAFHPLERIT